MNSIRLFLTPILLVAALLIGGCGDSGTATPTPTNTLKTYPGPPPVIIDTEKQYTATIVTEKGNLILELFARDAPVTVNNFIFLARDGFYDGTTFYRVIPGYVAQAGDPTGTGLFRPGYSIPDEFSEHTHVAGALSMANRGDPNSGSCHFFITYAPYPEFDNKYSVFGRLIEGMDVLENLTPREPFTPGFKGDKIVRIQIEERQP